MACFEGLFDSTSDSIIQDLLFTFATWHGYAKLRLHTDSSLEDFGRMTFTLGQLLRRFKKKVCSKFATQETPHEAERRGRNAIRRAAKRGALRYTLAAARRRRTVKKEFNLETIKTHSIGHYEEMIRAFGTTDLYSTRTASLSFIFLLSLIILVAGRIKSSTL